MRKRISRDQKGESRMNDLKQFQSPKFCLKLFPLNYLVMILVILKHSHINLQNQHLITKSDYIECLYEFIIHNRGVEYMYHQ